MCHTENVSRRSLAQRHLSTRFLLGSIAERGTDLNLKELSYRSCQSSSTAVSWPTEVLSVSLFAPSERTRAAKEEKWNAKNQR